ncbi:MAG: sulfate reduction electron transfer complex DsrMKJOP subunit DsrJ [Elusimicrobia bacterium]|nr:sulfate reduction electron transfer complex DsrMKJOP subunit DsrJ [Elusimicrobiota bacterium]
MHDTGKILAGLAVFLALATSPLWYASLARSSAAAPRLDLPAAERRCVLPREVIRASHMQLLDEWRTQVVRDGQRDYVTPDGRRFDKSLTRTCLKCHSNEKNFCSRCHDYAGAKPVCWNCHVKPEDIK